MKKIGIVGGVAWRSTLEYYSQICRRCEQAQLARNPKTIPSIPEISIESLDFHKAVSYLGRDDEEASWRQFDEYHRRALLRLESSGAEVALIASNTPHHRFTPIVRGIRIPVLNIVDAAARESARIGATEVLILGTTLTMQSKPFREGFEKLGIPAAGPRSAQARGRTVALTEELQVGNGKGAAEELCAIVRRATSRAESQPSVCLACTELPLAFPQHSMRASFEHDGIRFINPTAAHIEAVLQFVWSE